MGRHKNVLMLAIWLVTIALTAGCNLWQGSDISVDEFPICTNSASQGLPAISGNIVVWVDGRNGAESIYGYNLETETEFLIYTVEPKQHINPELSWPDVSGNIVVWQELSEETGYDIWGYNLETGTRFPIWTGERSQEHPIISGDFVLWLDRVEPAVYHICAYNLSTREIVISLPPRQIFEGHFDLDSDIAVWIEGGIKGYNLKEGHEFSISPGGSKSYVSISGNTVVWKDISPTSPLWREGRAGDLVAYDLTTQQEFRLPRTWSKIYYPAVGGEFIIWVEDIFYDSDIYGYDLRTRSQFPVAVGKGDQERHDIDGDIVVWMDRRSGKGDIYGARISRVSE